MSYLQEGQQYVWLLYLRLWSWFHPFEASLRGMYLDSQVVQKWSSTTAEVVLKQDGHSDSRLGPKSKPQGGAGGLAAPSDLRCAYLATPPGGRRDAREAHAPGLPSGRLLCVERLARAAGSHVPGATGCGPGGRCGRALLPNGS